MAVTGTYEAGQGVIRLDQRLPLDDRTRAKLAVEPLEARVSLARRLCGRVVLPEDTARHIVEGEEMIDLE